MSVQLRTVTTPITKTVKVPILPEGEGLNYKYQVIKKKSTIYTSLAEGEQRCDLTQEMTPSLKYSLRLLLPRVEETYLVVISSPFLIPI